MFTPKDAALERGWPGRIDGDRVVQLAAQTLQAFFTGGGSAREHAEYPLGEVDLRPPVIHPPAVRMFRGSQSLDFAFENPAAIRGPGDEVAWPEGADELHAHVGLAAIVGADGAIGGWTLANPWFGHGLPGAKQRDFALSLGPAVVTDPPAPAIRDSIAGRGDEAETSFDAPDWDALVAHAARNTHLRPGDLLVLDLGPGIGRLERGDVAELAHDEIGVLRNRVV
jgi:2-keto-4-pentenoate hydratase/2-oxohepta-3-ene-1,7-dioic acid hydratase in catechol pathway